MAAAKASRKARPTVKLRAEFAKGALCWRVKTHNPLIYGRASRDYAPLRHHQALEEAKRLPHEGFDNVRVSLTALAYNLRQAINILGVDP